jgi:mono/diheme cytochrome c family protein
MLALAAIVPHGQSISIAGAAGPDGSAIFNSKCATCHQPNGTGLPGAFPPLAKNPVVTGDPKKVIKIVLNGLTGTVSVAGKTYNGSMPAWKGQLSNAEIAAVLTYVRSSWGNKASAVTEAQVAAAAK